MVKYKSGLRRKSNQPHTMIFNSSKKLLLGMMLLFIPVTAAYAYQLANGDTQATEQQEEAGPSDDEPAEICGHDYGLVTKEYTIRDYKAHAAKVANSLWDCSEVQSFLRIIEKESSWIHNEAHYSDGKSSAYGFGGFLNQTWETVGCTKTSDPYIQIDCTSKYIKDRYDTPNLALIFHDKNNWY